MSSARDEYYSNDGIFIPVRAQNYVTKLEQQLSDMQKTIDIQFNANQELTGKKAELEQQNAELIEALELSVALLSNDDCINCEDVDCEIKGNCHVFDLKELLNKHTSEVNG